MTSIIYKLSDANGLIYYGSTQNLYGINYRMDRHKTSSNKCNSKIMDKKTMKIETLEQYCFDTYDKKFILDREAYYIKNFECINLKIPGQTQKEYYQINKESIRLRQKEYWKQNKEKIYQRTKTYYKKYYHNNKEKFSERYEKNKEEINKKFKCECGGQFTRQNKSKHSKTNIHKDYLKHSNSLSTSIES